MARIRLSLEITVLVMKFFSGLILSAALEDFRFLAIVLTAGILGWVLVDRWRLFYLPNWMANLLSIGVLYFSMRDFFSGDSSFQLMSVATLLVYLQSVMAFQDKRPRQYWQLLILNFLQVVIGAIFSLQFEGGLLFLIYLATASTGLWLLASYDQLVRAQHPDGGDRTSPNDWFRRRKPNEQKLAPVLTADAPVIEWRTARRAAGHLFSWILIAFSFGVALFVFLPRSERAWFGPLFRPVAPTGASRTIRVFPGAVITLSQELLLRMQASDARTGRPLRFDEPPYLRGMALGTWTTRDGHTTWEAPYDRVHMDLFEPLPPAPPGAGFAQIDITLDPTDDPMLYVFMPAYLPWGSDQTMEFCHELSVVTRRRGSDQIEMNLFRYTFQTPYVETSEGSGYINLADYYPYQPQSNALSGQSMIGSPGEYRWLTYADFSRYPTLVKTAAEQAHLAGGDNHLAIARQLEKFFSQSTEFSYTLNFRDVQWDPQLDAVEDFFKNIRRGHCELYASALTLMLRSQGIPARYVVGTFGGELNELGDFYIVRQGLAHAWVEVYIRPSDCTPEMKSNRHIAERGAWVRLDPTPGDSLSQRYYRGSFALDYARTMWEDYVLGLDAQKQDDWAESTGAMLFGLFDLSAWSNKAQQTMNAIQARPTWQLALVGLVLLVIIGGLIATIRRLRGVRIAGTQPISRWRRWIGSALSLIAPEIGGWILTDPTKARVSFYRRVLSALQNIGIERQAGETIRELSVRAGTNLGGRDPVLVEHLDWLTRLFHDVRFGGERISGEQKQEVDRRVKELERALQTLES